MHMSRHTLSGMGAGALSALLYLTVQWPSPGALILAYLSPLILYLVGFSLGATAVLIAMLTGTLVAFLAGSWLDALAYAVLNAAPAALLVRLSLMSRTSPDGQTTDWYPPGQILTWLAAGASVLFMAVLAWTSQNEGGLWYGLESFMQSMVQTFAAAGNKAPTVQLQDAVAKMSSLLPAMVGVSWMTMHVVNGLLALGLAIRFGWNLRPAADIAQLQVPKSLFYALAIALASAFLSDMMGLMARTIAIYLLYPYIFAGLGIVHLGARLTKARLALLLIFYLLLFILGWPLMLVAGLGMIDQWAGLRRRISGMRNHPENGQDNGQEKE
jgi:hypothetical protein